MSDIRSQTLHLVAKELATTLTEARSALESYAERSDQSAFLEKCADQLHSAHGVLRLVEVYGAALLAEEMEHVTRYLLSSDNDQKRQVDGLDALIGDRFTIDRLKAERLGVQRNRRIEIPDDDGDVIDFQATTSFA